MREIESGKMYQRTNGTMGDQITIALYPHDEKLMGKSMYVVLVLNERFTPCLEMRTVFEQDFTNYDEDYVHYQSASHETMYLRSIFNLLFEGKFEDKRGLFK